MAFTEQQRLVYAARAGNAEEATLLIDRGVHPDGPDDYSGEPLFAAIAAHHLDVVKVLLEKGASVKVADQNGDGPLEYALHHQDDKIVFELLTYGAKLHHQVKERYQQLLEQSLRRRGQSGKE